MILVIIEMTIVLTSESKFITFAFLNMKLHLPL